MKRYLKFVKGADGKIRKFGYVDDGVTKAMYGLCYAGDVSNTVEIVSNDYNKSAEELIREC